MNDAQRQFLADRLNVLSHEIDDARVTLENVTRRHVRAVENLAALEKELAALEEGIDW